MFRLIIKMAWRNSFLRLSRTFLVVTMIAVSMSMMLSLQGLYDGMALNMLDKNKRSESGDISIYAKEYRLTKDIKHTIDDASAIKEELMQIESVDAVVLRLKAEGLASTARKSSFSTLHGMDFKEEESFSRFSEFVKEGSLELGKHGAAIGIELAKELKLNLGSKVIFSTQDTNAEINSLALRVKAIVQTTNIVQDKSAIFIDKKRVYKFLSLDEHSVMQIAIISDDANLVNILRKRYPKLDIKTFLELQPTMKMMQEMMVIFNSITFFIVMGVVFVGIFGVLYVSVLDRVREFGIMRSIGMHYRYIKYQIFLEAVFISMAGYIAGALLGAVMLIYLKDHGLDFSAFSDALEMWGYESVIYGTIKPSYFITTFIAILSAALLSVLIPLRKIKKLNPVDVIKVEK